MTIEELRERTRELVELQKNGDSDKEIDHGNFDDWVMEYINDEELNKLREQLDFWYA